MPCSDGGPSQEQIWYERAPTKILCRLSKMLKAKGLLDEYRAAIVDYDNWLKAHAAHDKTRVRHAQVERQRLAKNRATGRKLSQAGLSVEDIKTLVRGF